MEKYSYLIAFFIILFSSCLKGGLENLPEFEDCNITGVQKVEYRFEQSNIIKYTALNAKVTIQENQVSIEVSVPTASGDFTEDVRDGVSLTKIAVMVTLSTAARIAPIGDSPKLGVPGDYSKPNKYLVTAADGKTQKEWTIVITKLIK